MKNIVYWFIENQPHFGMPRGAKNEFGPQRTNIECSTFKFKNYLQPCTKSGKKLLILYAKQPLKIIDTELQQKSYWVKGQLY